MIIYPAIDILEGKAVRLKRGDYSQMTVYGNDPISVAQGFKSVGTTWLHTVDLEGARLGHPANHEVIFKIAAETGLNVQVGGGIRTEDSIKMYLDAGIRRVILGTAAVSEPGFLREMASKYGDAIVAGADIKDGYVAIKGWTELSNQDVLTFCDEVKAIGVKTIICTDVSKDGMQSGSNVDLYRTLCKKLPIDIIASGGVSTLEEIKTLADYGVSGVIIGKALYEGTINLSDCLMIK